MAQTEGRRRNGEEATTAIRIMPQCEMNLAFVPPPPASCQHSPQAYLQSGRTTFHTVVNSCPFAFHFGAGLLRRIPAAAAAAPPSASNCSHLRVAAVKSASIHSFSKES